MSLEGLRWAKETEITYCHDELIIIKSGQKWESVLEGSLHSCWCNVLSLTLSEVKIRRSLWRQNSIPPLVSNLYLTVSILSVFSFLFGFLFLFFSNFYQLSYLHLLLQEISNSPGLSCLSSDLTGYVIKSHQSEDTSHRSWSLAANFFL